MSTKPKATPQPPEELRIGVFICNCGSNIAGHLDCKAVTEYAAELPDVVFTKENLYTCSEAGIAEIKKAITENNLNRVLVASCSPRTHQPLFASSCAEVGLNPYLFEMVNIRDQCSWVHMQEWDRATAKAKDLVRMGVAKASFLEPQQDIESSLNHRTMVIGGGVAGLSAAESMAGMGLEVVLVEREEALGGLARRLNRLAPENDPAAERIATLIGELEAQPNVTVYTGAEISSMDGYIGNFDANIRTREGAAVQEKIGGIVVATGAVPLNPSGLYGYDGQKVITQLELEERLRDDTCQAKRVVMIQCVGARSEERPYCSRICCMTAVKNAVLIKQHDPEAEVHVLYRDMQMYGPQRERMLEDARGQGIRFDVYNADQPPQVQPETVEYYQAIMGETRRIPYDLVVLSTPLVARDDVVALSQLLRVPIDQNGFFLEAHAKLRPLDFATDGIFVCGSARYPATVAEARSQGIGAAARLASLLFKDKLVTSALIAEINPDTCVGCMGCLDVCPFGAISYDPQKRICEVNQILCKGCGNCASTCPSQSARLKGFKPQQLLAQVRAA